MKINQLSIFKFIFLPVISGILIGCHDKSKELGVVESYKQPVLIEVPESVNANDNFSVQITTYGNPCYECGPTEVIRKGNLIDEIIPYDYFTHGKDCPDVPKYMTHSATLSFSVPGTATVSFLGMSELSDKEIIENRSINLL